MQYGTQIGSLLTRAETQRLVVDLYKQGMPIKEIAAQVPVYLATVYRWINLPKHKNVKQKAEPKTEDSSAGGDSKKSVNTDNINSETALLEAQIKELKAQLRAAELKACAYETMVNVAEKKFGIAIRKKTWRQTIDVLLRQGCPYGGVTALCKLFGVSKQAYYKARKEPTDETKVLVEEIIVKYCEDVRQKDPNIGGKKLWFMFCRQFPKELHVGRDRFADILSDNHLKLRQKKRKPRTTDSRHNLPTYPNLIKDVIPSRPYQVWVSDITYIPIKVSDWESGFAYLSLITDAYSHEVMGWRLGRDLSNRPALQALSMAFRIANERGVDICNGGLVHHSDRGVQYASKEYVEKLRSARIGISMTECGDPKENAIAERINSTLKNEILDKRRFESFEDLERALAQAIAFYNNCRPHLSNNLLTPAEASTVSGEIKKLWRSLREDHLRNKLIA